MKGLVTRWLERRDGAATSLDKLREAILGRTRCDISCKRLRELKHGRPQLLTQEEFCALDAFFVESFGYGFLREPALLEVMSSGPVRIVVGAYGRTDSRRADLSLWDLKSADAIADELGARTRRSPGSLLRIYTPVPAAPHHPVDALRLGRDELAQTDREGSPITRVVIGSVKANIVAECVLAELFSIDPFSRARTTSPFTFVWPDAPLSAFAQTGSGLANTDFHTWHGAVPENMVGLVLGRKTCLQELPLPQEKPPRTTAAIIAVVRQHSGALAVVLAGVTGPATLAATMALLHDPLLATVAVPGHPGGWWAAVTASVREGNKEEAALWGDDRNLVGSAEVVQGPSMLNLEKA
jgi:hypothetical protein